MLKKIATMVAALALVASSAMAATTGLELKFEENETRKYPLEGTSEITANALKQNTSAKGSNDKAAAFISTENIAKPTGANANEKPGFTNGIWVSGSTAYSDDGKTYGAYFNSNGVHVTSKDEAAFEVNVSGDSDDNIKVTVKTLASSGDKWESLRNKNIYMRAGWGTVENKDSFSISDFQVAYYTGGSDYYTSDAGNQEQSFHLYVGDVPTEAKPVTETATIAKIEAASAAMDSKSIAYAIGTGSPNEAQSFPGKDGTNTVVNVIANPNLLFGGIGDSRKTSVSTYLTYFIVKPNGAFYLETFEVQADGSYTLVTNEWKTGTAVEIQVVGKGAHGWKHVPHSGAHVGLTKVKAWDDIPANGIGYKDEGGNTYIINATAFSGYEPTSSGDSGCSINSSSTFSTILPLMLALAALALIATRQRA